MYNVMQSLTRQLDLIPVDKLEQNITIIGAGAIGSWVALSLAKMGFGAIEVYDDDVVSVENLASQFYPHTGINEKKVVVLDKMIEDFTGFSINTKTERFTNQFTKGIIIAAVDCMTARKQIWEAAKSNKCTAYIDPRMGAETMHLYIMDATNVKDIESYEKTLYSNEDAEHERCTAKTTMYCANVLAGLVVAGVKNVVCKEKYTRILTFDLRNHGYLSWENQ